RLTAKVRLVIFGVLQLGVVPKCRAVGIEQLSKLLLARRGLRKQPAIANLLNVTGFEVDLDREAILEFVELIRIQGRPRIVLGQGLLCRRNDPDLAVSKSLKVLGQAIEVEDQVVA